MKHTRTLRRATAVLAAAVTLGLGTTTAHADPGIPNVGYGYPNPAKSVRCVQFFINSYLGMHTVDEDGLFGPRTQQGVKDLQRHSNFNWTTHELATDGVFGKATGQAVLEHVKQNPWSIDYNRAWSCSHYVPSYTVVLN
ncbi:peptidoglycan-binding protein [Streptomyces sp. WAC06614]|uniref:peptidoglycan-binding domain-containing protein n=1 Tax=Streptomyces sp. WAC06614 TaxID=2487416 RepID=UPI000F7A053F|nr:peptidoglycan-binding domain-containing protein [Streptomyces sp. WAC06614]RSS75494.1 peptidoglycan-binding protein [Streptomyces sp. WAC06614]